MKWQWIILMLLISCVALPAQSASDDEGLVRQRIVNFIHDLDVYRSAQAEARNGKVSAKKLSELNAKASSHFINPEPRSFGMFSEGTKYEVISEISIKGNQAMVQATYTKNNHTLCATFYSLEKRDGKWKIGDVMWPGF